MTRSWIPEVNSRASASTRPNTRTDHHNTAALHSCALLNQTGWLRSRPRTLPANLCASSTFQNLLVWLMYARGTSSCLSSSPVHGKPLPAYLNASRSRHHKHCQATLGSDSTGFGQPPLVSDTVKQLADRVRKKPGSAKPTLRQYNPGRQGCTLADGQLLEFERDGHLTTRALLLQTEVLQLEQVRLSSLTQNNLNNIGICVACMGAFSEDQSDTAVVADCETGGGEPGTGGP